MRGNNSNCVTKCGVGAQQQIKSYSVTVHDTGETVCVKAKTNVKLTVHYMCSPLAFYNAKPSIKSIISSWQASLFFHSFTAVFWNLLFWHTTFVSFCCAVCCGCCLVLHVCHQTWCTCNWPNAVKLVVYMVFMPVVGAEIIAKSEASTSESTSRNRHYTLKMICNWTNATENLAVLQQITTDNFLPKIKTSVLVLIFS